MNYLWRGDWKPGTIEPARYLFDHELVLVTRGSCSVRAGQTTHELQTGEYIIIPPDTNHVTTTGVRGVQRWCVHFDWDYHTTKKDRPLCCFYPRRPKRNLITEAPHFVPRARYLGRFSPKGPIPALLETLLFRWQVREDIERSLCRAVLLEILIHLTGKRQRPSPQAPRLRQLAYQVKDLLDRPGESSDGLQQLLATLGFSYAHACRAFGKNFGVTPGEYRNARRLEQAKALLRNPKSTISEAAYAAGFSDVCYFNRRFRQQNGMTPKQFRKS